MKREGSERKIDPKDKSDNVKHKPLAEYTVGRRVTTIKQIFKTAVRAKWIQENPFDELRAGGKKDAARDIYVSSEWISKMVKSANNWEWRAIIALNGFAGLRGPSEILTLRWDNIWFDRGVCGEMKVLSPKTEHHEGQESRIVPIFPELEPHLREAEQMAQQIANDEGRAVEFVIDSYRGEWRKNLNRNYDLISDRAGLGKIPKPYVNARGSRETDLLASGLFDIAQIAGWWGHRVEEAQSSYLKFNKLRSETGLQTLIDAQANNGLAELLSIQKVAHKTGAAGGRNGAHSAETAPLEIQKTPQKPCFAGFFMGDEGLEPPTSSV